MHEERRMVVVVDSARLRVYVLEPRSTGSETEIPPLREVAAMVNPARRSRDSEVFSESRPGLRQGSGGGQVHGVDDRRGSHKDELDRRFTVDVVDRVAELGRKMVGCEIILAAPPHMLGLLRGKIATWTARGHEVKELSSDLTSMSPAQLHDHLAGEELVPPRSRRGLRNSTSQ